MKKGLTPLLLFRRELSKMHVTYDKLTFPPNVAIYVREIVQGKPLKTIPAGWNGLIIYHPASNQYYSSKSEDPLFYEEIIRTRLPVGRWEGTALSLRNLLDHHPDYQFFVTSMRSRTTVEMSLANMGKARVATKMGAMSTDYHVLFEVSSPFNRMTRYVCAPSQTPQEDLIAQANDSIDNWLKSKARIHGPERRTMRVALRYNSPNMPPVFEEKSEVTATPLLNGVEHRKFRTITMQKNLEAIQAFIHRTTFGG